MPQYRIPVEETFSWQRPIISVLNDPPVSPAKGDRYIVGTGTGDWVGHDKDIAWFDGEDWKFDTPLEGWAIFNKSDDKIYTFSGTVWVEIPVGEGDMTKVVYDTDDDGVVNAADKAGTYDDELGAIKMDF